jgi:hypothetical protein
MTTYSFMFFDIRFGLRFKVGSRSTNQEIDPVARTVVAAAVPRGRRVQRRKRAARVGQRRYGRVRDAVAAGRVMAQFWVGATDVNFMLLNIGGWHVGSYAAREAAIAVSYAIERGWVQERTHYFPYDGSTGQAYELTDAGLAYVEWAWGFAKRPAPSAPGSGTATARRQRKITNAQTVQNG